MTCEVSADLQDYKGKQSDNILFLTDKTWCYLAAENYSYGTLSAWTPEGNQSTIDRLRMYYSVNPDKKPTYIYILKDSKWNLTNLHAEANKYGYSVLESQVSYKLQK